MTAKPRCTWAPGVLKRRTLAGASPCSRFPLHWGEQGHSYISQNIDKKFNFFSTFWVSLKNPQSSLWKAPSFLNKSQISHQISHTFSFFFTSLETFFVVVFILYPITMFPMIITSYSYEIFLALHEFLKYFLQQGNLKNSAPQLPNVNI